jgi:predicted DNA-binding transcriptional regulator AlpA
MSKPTFDQIPELVFETHERVERIEAFLAEFFGKTHSNADEPINIQQASLLIGKKVSTIYGYTHRKEIPHFKKGIHVYFFKDQLIKWIQEGKRKTVEEIEQEAEELLCRKKPKNK